MDANWINEEHSMTTNRRSVSSRKSIILFIFITTMAELYFLVTERGRNNINIDSHNSENKLDKIVEVGEEPLRI